MYTSSDSLLMYICFCRIRLNQSTISGSISMSPLPSEKQHTHHLSSTLFIHFSASQPHASVNEFLQGSIKLKCSDDNIQIQFYALLMSNNAATELKENNSGIAV